MKQLFLLVFIFCVLCTQAQERDSLDIKIGQMILIGLPTSAVDQKVLEEVRNGKAGSIILFEKNIPKDNSFVALKKITWTYQQAAPIPLFIAIDQEGGKVNRLKDKYGFPRSITAEEMGKDLNLDSVRFYGEATAATLKGLGININFAPVVDLAVNPQNPVIVKNGRAFSADETVVTNMARAWIESHREMGVITSLKHFPGHGSSRDDTHLGIADVTNTWTERELLPYKELISSGTVDAVMTAHIVNRKLDPKGNPGTLSYAILHDILRGKLGYEGVIFSDDMQMHAITKHYGLEEAIRLAINAGVDIMTFSNNISGSDERTVDRVHQIIKSLVANGQISQERIDQSFKRIMTLKKRLMPVVKEEHADNCEVYEQQIQQLEVQLKKLEGEMEKMKTQQEASSEAKKKRKKNK